jgi:hypothetical protein
VPLLMPTPTEHAGATALRRDLTVTPEESQVMQHSKAQADLAMKLARRCGCLYHRWLAWLSGSGPGLNGRRP